MQVVQRFESRGRERMRRVQRCQFCGCKLRIVGEHELCRCEVCDKAYRKGYQDGVYSDKDKVLDNEIQRARNIANEFYALKQQWKENVAAVIKFHSGLANIEKKLERLEKKVGE